MSVMIRGMEMPKDCRECRFMEYYSHRGETWCLPANVRMAKNYKPISYGGIPDWCPLVELPEKHGRLIDADVLLKIYGDWCEKLSERYGFDSSELGVLCGAGNLLDSQPVVVEAEGEG